MEALIKKLSFYIALDKKEIIGLDSFGIEERKLLVMGLPKVSTSRGTYEKVEDISRVIPVEEAMLKFDFGKWHSPCPVPVREFKYAAI